MNVIKEIEKITHLELDNGIVGGVTNGSWHDKYRNSAWVYVGGLSTELTEGDVICVMSQWGEIEDINLVRDKGTNKSLGYAFIKYEDQRSTILAVDNFNGIKLLGRVLRCDHVDKYKLPKDVLKREEEMLELNPSADVDIGPGHTYKAKELASEYNIHKGVDLWNTSNTDNGDNYHSSHNKNGSGNNDRSRRHQASYEYLSDHSRHSDESRLDYSHVNKKDKKDKKHKKHHKEKIKKNDDNDHNDSRSPSSSSRRYKHNNDDNNYNKPKDSSSDHHYDSRRRSNSRDRHTNRYREHSRDRNNNNNNNNNNNRGRERDKRYSDSEDSRSRQSKRSRYETTDYSTNKDEYYDRNINDHREKLTDMNKEFTRDNMGKEIRDIEANKTMPRVLLAKRPDGSSTAPVLSWRGRKDPTVTILPHTQNKKSDNQQSESAEKPMRKEWQGFAGMNRRR